MASPEIRPNRQLRELLQEEQEPFILENYLLERGHSKKGSKSEPSKVLNKSTSCHLQKIKKGFLYPSKLIKSVCKKLVLVNKSFRIKNCDDKVSVQETSRNMPGAASPAYLNGSLPGDNGFDPLALAEDPENLRWFVQAELVNGRWAMLGVAGMLLPEVFTKIGILNVPQWYDAGKQQYFASSSTLFVIEFILFHYVEIRRWQDIKNPAGGEGEEEVKLLGAWFSPFVLRAEWALKLKGVPYELVPEEDLGNKSRLLLETNPIYQKIPVLLHAHKPILESLLIVEYIDETWNHEPFILPHHPLHKALTKFWVKFIDEKLTEAIRTAIVTEGEAQEKAVKQAKEALETIEREVMVVEKRLVLVEGGGKNKIGLVDIALGWIAIWLTVVEEIASVQIFDSEKYPLVFEWMNNFLALPVVKENMPPRDKLVVYFTNMRRAYV